MTTQTEKRSIDYTGIADSIAETIAKGEKPLSENQRLLLVGALSVWLNKIEREAILSCVNACKRIQEQYRETIKKQPSGKSQMLDDYMSGARVCEIELISFAKLKEQK